MDFLFLGIYVDFLSRQANDTIPYISLRPFPF